MKIKILTILFLVQHLTYSQYKIEYEYTLGTITASVKIKSYLYTDGKKSKFVKDQVVNGKSESEMQNVSSAVLDKIKSLNIKEPGDSIGYVIIKTMDSDTINSKLLNSKGEYVKIVEANNPIVEIFSEYKSIFDYKCQKAIINYGERIFEVWFTEEIPLSDGPWKLKGLPGLILSAKTIDGFHQFLIQKVSNSQQYKNEFFAFPFTQVLSKESYVSDYLREFEKRFKYRKSKASVGATIKASINNLDLPLTNLE